MRRKPEPHAVKPRRKRYADIPPVPTVRPESARDPAPNIATPETKEDPTEEAVRRMVEAAYT